VAGIQPTTSVFPNIIKMNIPNGMKRLGNVECLGENRNSCSVLVGKPE
jgi:hypothetical protein